MEAQRHLGVLAPVRGDFAYSISGLSPNTTYHFRIAAYNSGGTTLSGNDLTFTTSVQAPTVQTLAATSVTTTSATVNGSVDPHGASTTFYFEYGMTPSYGMTTTPGNTTVAINVSGPITGLAPNTAYHYRFVAYNSGGTTYGNDVTFTTSTQPAPTVQTLAATSVTTTSATVNGSVNPNGVSSTFYFEYGTTTSYGTTTTPGNTTVAINASGPITGLAPNTTYHYRFVAYNSGGTTYGNDVTFTTSTQPAPTVQTLAATSVTTTSATVNGSVNPNGVSTTFYFEYGTTTSYGTTTPSGLTSVPINVSGPINGLTPEHGLSLPIRRVQQQRNHRRY